MILSRRQVGHLQSYRYTGKDASYIYKYLLSPLAEFCVKHFIPLTVSPNVITLAGLAFSCLACLLTLLSNPQLDKPHVYQSHHLISGICIFMYQTLDNMDGKQARRTSSSSPLGMLFDHGCDAINATVLCIPISSALSTEWSMGIFFALWCGYVPFFFQTWEEYYLGEMVLPCINGPSEGLLIAVGICLVSYLKGPLWWHQPLPPMDMLSFISMTTPFHLLVAIAVSGALVTVSLQVYKVLTRVKASQRREAALSIIPFLVFFISAYLYCQTSSVLHSNPLTMLVLLGAIFVDLVTHIMISHLLGDPLCPLQRYLVTSIPLLLARHWASGFGGKIPLFPSEDTLLRGFSLWAVISVTIRSAQIVDAFADALQINIFTLEKRRRPENLARASKNS